MIQCLSILGHAAARTRSRGCISYRVGLVLLLAIPWSAVRAQTMEFTDALRLANAHSALVRARNASLEGATALQISAAQLPDPRISLGVDGLPVNGPNRGSLTRTDSTKRQIGLSQEVPNRAKRAARADVAAARVERERTLAHLERLNVRRESGLAWLALHFAEKKLALFESLAGHQRLLKDTAPAQLAAGRINPADVATVQLEALALDDRRDELLRDVAQARASLTRWVGTEVKTTPAGATPALNVDAQRIRARLDMAPDFAVFEPMLAMANAELSEAEAAKGGDWAWSVNYGKRGPGYDDMLSVQLTFELPWAQSQRQQPQIAARVKEVEKTLAEQSDVRQRQTLVFELLLAELNELEAKLARVSQQAMPLAAQKTALTLTGYQAGRDKLGAVLESRKQEAEIALRELDLMARRHALQWRINSLVTGQE